MDGRIELGAEQRGVFRYSFGRNSVHWRRTISLLVHLFICK